MRDRSGAFHAAERPFPALRLSLKPISGLRMKDSIWGPNAAPAALRPICRIVPEPAKP